MNTASRIVYVDNTGADTRMFHEAFVACVLENKPLPEEIADLFDFKVIEVDGLPRGILNFA